MRALGVVAGIWNPWWPCLSSMWKWDNSNNNDNACSGAERQTCNFLTCRPSVKTIFLTDVKARDEPSLKVFIQCIYPVIVVDTINMQISAMYGVKNQIINTKEITVTQS